MTTITPASTGATSRGTPAGVRQAELSVQLGADNLNARLQWASARAGEIDATASTRLQWGENAAPWPADAPLARKRSGIGERGSAGGGLCHSGNH